jgi:hypothetical protein
MSHVRRTAWRRRREKMPRDQRLLVWRGGE